MMCLCGCGQETGIWDENDATRGRVKGAPKRWIAGHSVRKRRYGADHPNWKGGRWQTNYGYVYLSDPAHPRANEHGYVLEHILVAEKALGKYLPRSAQVHHINGNRADNRGSNLVVCQSQAYHSLLHYRMRAKAACGNPNWMCCGYCGAYDDPALMYIRPKKHVAYHPTCERDYQRQRKASPRHTA